MGQEVTQTRHVSRVMLMQPQEYLLDKFLRHSHTECCFKMALNFSMMAFSHYFTTATSLLLRIAIELQPINPAEHRSQSNDNVF